MTMHVKPKHMPSTDRVHLLRLQLVIAEHQKRFGQRIAEARKAKRWSQAELAREVETLRRRNTPSAASVDASTISRYERGRVDPSPEMKDYLAKALGRDVSWFLVEEPNGAGTPQLLGRDGIQARLDAIEARLAEIERLLRGSPAEYAERVVAELRRQREADSEPAALQPKPRARHGRAR